MRADQSRPDLILGAILITAGAVLSYVSGLPAYLFSVMILTGAVLWVQAAATLHTFQTALRFERTAMAMAKAPKPQIPPVVRTVPANLRDLIYDWSKGEPTTKEYAINTRRVTQGQWQAAVAWAVRHDLGVLVPAQGGAEKLRWTAKSLNDFLPLMDGLAN